MSAEILRRASALMRERAEARTRLPQGARRCDRGDHPDSAHGHYGYGGRYSCSDFRSPLLSESNMGSRTVYAKPKKSPDAFLLAVADWLDGAAAGWLKEQDRQWGLVLIGHDWQIPEGTSERNELQRKCDKAADVRFKKALAAARTYLGEQS